MSSHESSVNYTERIFKIKIPVITAAARQCIAAVMVKKNRTQASK